VSAAVAVALVRSGRAKRDAARGVFYVDGVNVGTPRELVAAWVAILAYLP
jgi:hypothetical protein